MITRTSSTPKSCKLIWTMWSRTAAPSSDGDDAAAHGRRRWRTLPSSKLCREGSTTANLWPRRRPRKTKAPSGSSLPPVMSRASTPYWKTCLSRTRSSACSPSDQGRGLWARCVEGQQARLQGGSRARREFVSGDDHSSHETGPGHLSVAAPRPRGQGSIKLPAAGLDRLAALFKRGRSL